MQGGQLTGLNDTGTLSVIRCSRPQNSTVTNRLNKQSLNRHSQPAQAEGGRLRCGKFISRRLNICSLKRTSTHHFFRAARTVQVRLCTSQIYFLASFRAKMQAALAHFCFHTCTWYTNALRIRTDPCLRLGSLSYSRRSDARLASVPSEDHNWCFPAPFVLSIELPAPRHFLNSSLQQCFP